MCIVLSIRTNPVETVLCRIVMYMIQGVVFITELASKLRLFGDVHWVGDIWSDVYFTEFHANV